MKSNLYENLLSIDPIGAFSKIRENYLRYFKTMYSFNDEELNDRKDRTLENNNTLSRNPFFEILTEYNTTRIKDKDIESITDLTEIATPGFDGKREIAYDFFEKFIKPGLMNYPPYQHQTDMFIKAFVKNKNTVINSGTGSGKTESFLLPLLAGLYREAKTWNKPNYNIPNWFDIESDERGYLPIQRQGEKRIAALRSLILYPMNALVEDQMTRLRKALDSDEVRKHFDNDKGLKGNRIYFGQYNGSTITSGNFQGKPNRRKREFCFKKLREIRNNSNSVEAYAVQNNSKKEDVLYIAPRLTTSSRTSEMVTRWDMQLSPPDILITNFSMLGVMLMRDIESNMFESTRKWIEEDKRNVFHLVVDELHLFRGTSGTEIAFLIRMFLDVIGVRPVIEINGKKIPNPQLRILASSASLGDENKTQKYLEQFFGVYFEDKTKKAFEIQSGSDYSPKLGPQLNLRAFSEIDETYLLKTKSEKGKLKSKLAYKLGFSTLGEYFNSNFENIYARFNEACKNKHGKIVPIALDDLAEKLFNGNVKALRGFLIIRADDEINLLKDIKLPRIRFHQFYKYIEGLWAELLPQKENTVQKPFGELMYLPMSAKNGNDGTIHKVLETLRCEKCASPFIGGNKSVLPECNDVQKWELSLNSPDLNKIPNNQVTPMVQNKWYHEYAVFWPSQNNDDRYALMEQGDDGIRGRNDFQQTNINRVRTYAQTGVRGNWRKSFLNPFNGELIFRDQMPSQEYIEGFTFVLTVNRLNSDDIIDFQENNEFDFLEALPHICPSCNADYSARLYTKSPIRSFRTGIARSNQVLSKELLYQLNEKNPKLVGFSDSRQDAAKQAFGIEKEHFRDILRVLFLQCIEDLNTPNLRILELIQKTRDIGEKIYPEIKEYKSEIPNAYDIVDFVLTDNKEALNQYLNPQGTFNLESIIEADNNQLNGPLIKKLLELGINPNGVGFEKESEGGYHWSNFYDFENGTIAPITLIRNRIQDNNYNFGPSFINGVKELLYATIFRNSFGIYTDINSESAGIGFLKIRQRKNNEFYLALSRQIPKDLHVDNFLNSFLRIMGDNYRYANPDFFVSTSYGNYHSLPIKFRRLIEVFSDLHDLESEELGNNLYNYLSFVFGNVMFEIMPNSLEFEGVKNNSKYFQCTNCKKIHLHIGSGLCTNLQCLNELPRVPTGSVDHLRANNFISFDVLKEPRKSIRLRTAELTGQTDNQSERQLQFKGVVVQNDKIENNKDRLSQEIDMINVTTTMEVGVDIGSLQAIFLGNMPPTRYNYQQRVGRCGRRGQAFSAALTFCRGKSHDTYYYYDGIEEIIGGDAPSPILALEPTYINGKYEIKAPIVRRMLTKTILKFAFNSIEVDQINIDTHGEFGLSEAWLNYRPNVKEWLLNNKNIINEYVKYYLSQFNQNNRINEDIEKLKQWLYLDLIEEIDKAVESNTYTEGLAQTLAEAGLLPMYGMPSNTRNLYHGSNGNNLKSIDRSLEQAITEFAPGSIKTKDKGEYESIGITVPLKIVSGTDRKRRIKTFQKFNGQNQEQLNALEYSYNLILDENNNIINIQDFGDEVEEFHEHRRLVIPKAFRSDRLFTNNGNNLNNVDAISNYSSSRIFANENENSVTGSSRDNYNLFYYGSGSDIWHINNNNGNYFEGVAIRNFKSSGEWENTEIDKNLNVAIENLDFTPNFIISRYLSDRENRSLEEIALGTKKTTEMIKLELVNIPPALNLNLITGNTAAIKSAFYSAAFILQRVVADILDVDPQEIEISELKKTNGIPYLYLSDAAPNGSGFVNYIYQNFNEILDSILENKHKFINAIVDHKIDCNTSCQKCLNTYNNLGYHHILDWRLGIGLLRLMKDANYTYGLKETLPEYFENEDLISLINKSAETYSKINPSIESLDGVRFKYLKKITGDSMIGFTTKYNIIIHPLWNVSMVLNSLRELYGNIEIQEDKVLNIFNTLRVVKY